MAVYTLSTSLLRVQTQRSEGRPFAAEMTLGTPYIGTSANDERLIATASAGQSMVRGGIPQDNYILAPNSGASWFGFQNDDFYEGANDGPFGGLNSMHVTANGVDEWWGLGQSPNVASAAFETWNFSAYFKSPSGAASRARLFVDFFAGAVYQSSVDAVFTKVADTTWTRHSMSFSIPAGTNMSWTPYLMAAAGSGTAPFGREVVFASVQATKTGIFPGDMLHTFFSGEWGGSWRGDPNYSASYRLY